MLEGESYQWGWLAVGCSSSCAFSTSLLNDNSNNEHDDLVSQEVVLGDDFESMWLGLLKWERDLGCLNRQADPPPTKLNHV